MAKCLVTGHRGYIGSRVYNKLIELGHEVKGIDLKDGQNIIGDLWLAEYTDFKPEYIFHLAAIPRVAYSMEFPYEVLHNNIVSSITVLDYARRQGTKRVIYSSSSSVRGNGDGPTSPYGASKLVPETLCKNYSTAFGVDTVCLRYFNVYSEDQEAEGPYATAVANWMKYIREGQKPFITGTGEQRRDMLHVEDAVSANVFCMNYEQDFNGQHFDVGTGKNISLNEMRNIAQEFNSGVEFIYIPDRPGDVDYTKADTEPLRELGWQTKNSVIDGISRCFKGVRNEV
tara:strand:- start:213 stop:1067 length:855 start_codon:yes stop_codon:yes gene_type:complete